MSGNIKETTSVEAPADAVLEQKEEGLNALIDAQLDDIVCGGWSRVSFTKTKPH